MTALPLADITFVSRHERHDIEVVAVKVVAPDERVVDAAAVGRSEVPLDVADLVDGAAGVRGEQIDLGLVLQQSSPVSTPLAGPPMRLSTRDADAP